MNSQQVYNKKNHCHQSTCICQLKPHEMSAHTCYGLLTTPTETYSNNMCCQGIERWTNPCTLLEQKWPRTMEQYGGFSNGTNRTAAIWSTNAGNISERTEIWILKRHYHLPVLFLCYSWQIRCGNYFKVHNVEQGHLLSLLMEKLRQDDYCSRYTWASGHIQAYFGQLQ